MADKTLEITEEYIQPGARITSRVPYADYAAIKAHSISALKMLRMSPKHYQYALAHPKESPALTLGTAAHTAVLEPERFERDFAIWTRRTESGNMAPRNGKIWDDFLNTAQGENQTVLTVDEANHARDIQTAVRSNPDVMRYLSAGDPEISMEWSMSIKRAVGENETFSCKGRADWLNKIDGRPCLTGLKTARDHRHYLFGAAAAKLGYHLQWAFYYDGYIRITGNIPHMAEIVVESNPPHDSVVYTIPDEILQQGHEEYCDLLRLYAHCNDTGEWPGVYQGEQILSLPSWVYGPQDDVSDLGLEE
jgi:exodeoxyribonuclease VIII